MRIEVKIAKGGSVALKTLKDDGGEAVVLEADEVPLNERCDGAYIVGGFALREEVSLDKRNGFVREISRILSVDPDFKADFDEYEIQAGVLLTHINIHEIKELLEEYKHLLRYFYCSIFHIVSTHEDIMLDEDNGSIEIFEQVGFYQRAGRRKII